MQEIKYIPVRKLWNHPDNPRKDLGDLSELVDSIKANGVLQNLTVVPKVGEITGKWDGESYTVIIGHRRLAAAKQAGLETVPCVVTDMARSEQLKTMLIENMQRSDLTVYEQAQGFQLMLDMGETVESIAKESGFSQSTVRRRVKLLELDPEKFKESEARGATLQDYMELDKIQDPERKNKTLEYIGTANFAAEVKRAVEEEKTKAYLMQTEAALSKFAVKIETSGKVGDEDVPMEYVNRYNAYGPKKEVVTPEDAGSVRYFYTTYAYAFTLYKERGTAEQHTESEEDRLRRERREVANRREAELTTITARHFELRKDFIKRFSAVKKHITTILWMAADAVIEAEDWNYGPDVDILEELLEIEIPDDADVEDIKELVADSLEKRPEYTLLALAYSSLDEADNSYWDRNWNGDTLTFDYEYSANDDLDRLYGLLSDLGYKVSDEESQMINGSHPLFQDETQEVSA